MKSKGRVRRCECDWYISNGRKEIGPAKGLIDAVICIGRVGVGLEGNGDC